MKLRDHAARPRTVINGIMWAVTVALLGAGPVGADEPVDEALKADIEVLRSRLQALESRLEGRTGSTLPATSGDVDTGDKPTTTVTLPSGLSDIQFSGYADVSYIYNFNEPDPSSSTRGNRGRTFDNEPNGFTPHVFELAVEKPVGDDIPLGFRADLFFGDDAELIHSTGAGATADQFDLQQLYVNGRVPMVEGLDFKVGKFVTPLGAEVIESPANWNFSRSFLFSYAIPFTHTGATVSYPVLGEYGSATVGVVNGWDVVDDNNKGKTFLGSLALTPMEDVTLYANLIAGPERSGDERNDRTVIDLVGSWKPLDELTLMANFDYGHESNNAPVVGTVGGGAGTDSSSWLGTALYAKYDLQEDWALAGRWEWFADRDGVRTALGGPDGAALNGLDLQSWTLTSQWTLHKHLLARLEYRHDFSNEHVFFQDSTAFSNTQDTVAAEMVYHF